MAKQAKPKDAKLKVNSKPRKHVSPLVRHRNAERDAKKAQEAAKKEAARVKRAEAYALYLQQEEHFAWLERREAFQKAKRQGAAK